MTSYYAAEKISSLRKLTACCFLLLFATLPGTSILYAQDENAFFVPIVLSSTGFNETHFTTELTLTNRSPQSVSLDFDYTAAFGGASGQASDSIPPGQQRIIPDTISYLKSLGIPIPDSVSRGGTLWIRMRGLPSPLEFGVTARTTLNVSGGKAGLSYPGIRPSEALNDPVYLFGLRQNDFDRTNLALQNMAADHQSTVTLRVTAFSGDVNNPLQHALPDVTLSPGGWFQFSEILHSDGLSLSNGYVRIERIQGSAPYYAYAVINDQVNSDGSFIPPVAENALAAQVPWTLPVVVGTTLFSSELVLTNLSSIEAEVNLSNSQGRHSIAQLRPGQQFIIEDLVEYLREHHIPTAGPIGQPFVGAVSAVGCAVGDCSQFPGNVFFGVRTFKEKDGGRYGMFYNGIPHGSTTANEVGLYGLQQNDGNRTNLAIVNTGEIGSDSDTFRLDLFDGDSGLMVNSLDGITVGPLEWRQIEGFLVDSGFSQGYAHIMRTSGSNRFIAYAVRNDGSQPGTGSGDGDFIAGSAWAYQPHLSIPIKFGGCGNTWFLYLTDAPPNTSVQLIGDSAGEPNGFSIPQGATTDNQGKYSASGSTKLILSGNYNLAVVVGGVRSNTVLVHIPTLDACNQ